MFKYISDDMYPSQNISGIAPKEKRLTLSDHIIATWYNKIAVKLTKLDIFCVTNISLTLYKYMSFMFYVVHNAPTIYADNIEPHINICL